MFLIRTHLKSGILLQNQGDNKFQPAGIRLYFEELERESKTEIETKTFLRQVIGSILEITCQWLIVQV